MKYAKFYVALGGFAAVVGKVLIDGQLEVSEIGELALAAAVALGVRQVTNTPTTNNGA